MINYGMPAHSIVAIAVLGGSPGRESGPVRGNGVLDCNRATEPPAHEQGSLFR